MWQIIVENRATLLEGLLTTLGVSAAALCIGAALGLALSALRRGPSKPLRRVAAVYLSFWRGTPILIQLFFVFYALPMLGLELSPVIAAIVTLALNTAAFQSEIYRAGLAAIPVGQVEAAGMLGMSRLSTLLRVETPQAIRLMLPALVGEMLALVRNSSLVSVIAVADMTRRAQQIASSTFRPLESYGAALMGYLALALLLSGLALWLEKRMGRE